MTTTGAAEFCGQCGEELHSIGGAPTEHPSCVSRAVLEPPRFCPRCGRRMVVQVDPVGWRATCSRHGELTG